MSRQVQPFPNVKNVCIQNPTHKENWQKGLVDNIRAGTKELWNKKVHGTQMEKFKSLIQKKYEVTFETYWDLYEWSIENYPQFWEELWHFYGVIHSKPYTESAKRKGDGFLDIEWFAGAEMNFAENLLRYRDERVALTCVNEDGDEKKVTYAEMFEEVKLYAAAFKKHGLQKGDRVASYITNRREAIYAMLAAASMGAMFGGPIPFHGPKNVSAVMNIMTPKFVITVDRFQHNRKEYNILKLLPGICNGCKSIEKVIIVPNGGDSKSKDITTVKNSYFIEEFLSAGRNPDGTVPDLIFEQLSFNHPVFINFTSGTTGFPKGIVHSAGSFLPLLRDHGLHWNLDRNSVVFSVQAPGWVLWNFFINFLALGSSLILYEGLPFFLSKHAFWDIIDHYKVSFIYFVASIMDVLEKEGKIPRPGCKLEHLKMISLGSCSVKLQNVDFILQKVKLDVFVGTSYGSTESMGYFSGFDYNTPVFSSEIQCPALGVDIKIFNDEGKSIVGQTGELVFATPTPSLPVGIWNDENGTKLKEIYLMKFPGVWAQSDTAWIDPVTKGIVVLGRSDNAIKQSGFRFVSEEIYWIIYDIEEVADAICVSQRSGSGEERAVLFVKMKNGHVLDKEMHIKIQEKIMKELAYLYVPKIILPVEGIPYNLNGKRMESVIRKIINTNTIPEVSNIRNPECLQNYWNLPQLQNF